MEESTITAAISPSPRRRRDGTKGTAVPQLSCEACRDRKVKCDKKLPSCTPCAIGGIACVPVRRQRQSRGRHVPRSRADSGTATATESRGGAAAAKSSQAASPSIEAGGGGSEEIGMRLRRLEEMIASVAGMKAGGGDPRLETLSLAHDRQGPGDALRTYRPEGIWTELADEIHELRGVVEGSYPLGEAEDEVDEPDPRLDAQGTPNSISDGMRTFGLSWTSAPSPFANMVRHSASSTQLCHIYLQQVDPIIKILHRPTLEGWLVHGQGYLRYPEGHASTESLRAAVCYAAASSLTDEQARAVFQANKSDLVAACRMACEAALERSNLLGTRDITVLQSFVLYLVARRTEERSRAVCEFSRVDLNGTLIAVAVRIAQGMRLHTDSSKQGSQHETFFAQQLRARLWLTICLLDIQSSYQRASKPLIDQDEASSCLASVRHVDDTDFGPETEQPGAPDREGLTDTTFALVTYHVQLGGRMINSAATPAGGSDRQGHARAFEQTVFGLLHFVDPESSPRAWFTWHGTQCLVAGTRTLALRPVVQSLTPGLSSNAAAHNPATGSTEVLAQAVAFLERMHLMHTDVRAAGFRWYMFVPWHVLALAMAECGACADSQLVRRAWPLVESLYGMHQAAVARGKGGLGGGLSGPLGRLMRRTREKLGPMLGDMGAVLTSSEATQEETPVRSYSSSPSTAIPNPAAGNTPQAWKPTAEPLFPPEPFLANLPTLSGHAASGTEAPEQSWNMWDEFLAEMDMSGNDGFDFGSWD